MRKISILILAAVMAAGCEILDFDAFRTPEMLVIQPATKTPGALQQSVQVDVLCDIKWKVELSDASWAAVENTVIGKDGKGSFTLTLTPNTAKESRELEIHVTAGKGKTSINITQEGLDTYFSASPLVLVGTDVAKATFKAPNAWKAEIVTGKDWLVLDAAKGYAGDAYVSCHASDPNQNIGSREGSLKIDFGTVSVELPVVQNQMDVILSQDSEASFDWQGGEFSVHTSTNVEYTIECNAGWVKHTTTKALNQATEGFVVEPNLTASVRNASITFRGGDASYTVKVSQGAMDPFLNVTTPGFYGIGGMDYVLGSNGWNQAGRRALASGGLDLRLMNRSTLSVISVAGARTDAKVSSQAILTVVMKTGNRETLRTSFNTTVLWEDDNLLWFKAEPSTCFIVKK
jgi:hypothetical protein